MFDLAGKIAVITGASSGLAADSARACAKSGRALPGGNVIIIRHCKIS
jgi:short-subunit dehydrogenase